MQTKIYVGNLSYSVTEHDLRQFYSEFGSISEVIIPQDRETGRVRGFAFVSFENQAEAQNALLTNGKEFMGRTLKVNIAKERETTGGGGGGRSGGGGFGGRGRG